MTTKNTDSLRADINKTEEIGRQIDEILKGLSPVEALTVAGLSAAMQLADMAFAAKETEQERSDALETLAASFTRDITRVARLWLAVRMGYREQAPKESSDEQA